MQGNIFSLLTRGSQPGPTGRSGVVLTSSREAGSEELLPLMWQLFDKLIEERETQAAESWRVSKLSRA
jgi:hypothetical protein